MKLKEIFKLFIQEGIKTDLRTKAQLQSFLRLKRKEYNALKPSLKKFFDKDSLTNPFADTKILYGDPEQEIRRVLVGIDMEVSELLLADQISQNGASIDLVLAHHPEGVALAGLYDVMHLQTDVLENLGFERHVAEGLMNRRINKVTRGLHGVNHTRTVDAARLLNLPFMCCHTPADNHVSLYLQKMMDSNKPKTLQHMIDLLMKEPEFQDAVINKAGPVILAGKSKDKAGKVFVDMTGGTEGSHDIYARMSQLGIKTYLGMHLSEAHFRKIKSEYTNVIISGHMASDNLGINLLLDKLEKKGRIDIISVSGFRRFRR